MTDLAEALLSRLTSDAAVTALVGDRVHWVKRDQGGALPVIVLRRVSGQRPELLDGEEDMLTSRVQADCMAWSHAAAWALAAAARAVLLPEAGVGDMLFWRASADAPRDLGEQLPEGFVHRASVDFIIRHTAGSE